MEENWEPDEDLVRFIQERNEAQIMKLWHYIAWFVVGVFFAIVMVGLATMDWGEDWLGLLFYSLLAIFSRFILLKMLAGYSHATCTIIGIAAIACSYIIDNDGSLFPRLIIGLLL